MFQIIKHFINIFYASFINDLNFLQLKNDLIITYTINHIHIFSTILANTIIKKIIYLILVHDYPSPPMIKRTGAKKIKMGRNQREKQKQKKQMKKRRTTGLSPKVYYYYYSRRRRIMQQFFFYFL